MNAPLKYVLVFLLSLAISCGKDEPRLIVPNQLTTEIKVPEDYATIQEAINAAKEGEVILLSPGTYSITEPLKINKKVTLASNYINTENDSDVDQVVITSNQNLEPLILFEDGSEESVCTGITFKNARKQVIIECDYMTITHCKFFDSGSDALSFEGAGGYVAYNYFENCGDEAIDADNSLDWIVEYNEIINPKDDGLEIRLHNDNKAERVHIIRYNYISGAGEDGIQLIDYDGNSGREFQIHHNTIINSAMVGLGCTINGNTVEDYNGSYMEEKAFVYNNVFNNNNHGITGANNMLVFNNIISKSENTGIKKLDNNSKADFNCFFNNTVDFSNAILGDSNIFEDPLFNPDFSLDLNSLCIEAGTITYVNNDLSQTVADVDIFGNKPDMGAIEYDGASINNIAPTVSAGSNQVITSSQTTLLGEVTDDGLPSSGSLTFLWSFVDGPLGETVGFDNMNNKETSATFNKQGSYDLKLVASDGEKSRSDVLNVYYVKDFNDVIINLDTDTYIEAENYRYLVGSARVINNNGASEGKIVNAEPGQGTWAYSEYRLVTFASGTYYVWINASGIDSNSNGIKVAFNDLNTEIPIDGTITNSFDGSSWVKIAFNNIPEGVYPLRIYATEEGVSWDRIFITTDSNLEPGQ
ncbi:MAG: hypothetical protein COA50_04500 [Flavobacteriaceae bacterium]|nr:MAG: hypothetical protein COA50_04500 [Flavobacteriaceae bacterium]